MTTIWIEDTDHRATATMLARFHNEGKLLALAAAIATTTPCPYAGEYTADQIVTIMGEAVDVWPDSVRISLDEEAAQIARRAEANALLA